MGRKDPAARYSRDIDMIQHRRFSNRQAREEGVACKQSKGVKETYVRAAPSSSVQRVLP